ncbi:uncharacterized protein F4812DRAFT_372765 [Daldinia caldariorum]|uniref:uncharacterized protein n=1 Tax=Daldinia caldariorum TaxID=326644 RepID=UPI002008E6CE|nr:uncharacterized protein F4812DRAFT_372765 [Daldinia caldariorum]KAI1468551.1 hypothetical protein F4812DRAFT_372765 [Daldinia caldariorum]
MKSAVVSKTDLEAKHSTITTAKKEVWDLLQLAESENSLSILTSLKNVTASQIAWNSDINSFSDELRKLEEPIRRTDYHVQLVNDNLERNTRAHILKAISTIPYGAHHCKSSEDNYQNATLPKGRSMSSRGVDVVIYTYRDYLPHRRYCDTLTHNP